MMLGALEALKLYVVLKNELLLKSTHIKTFNDLCDMYLFLRDLLW